MRIAFMLPAVFALNGPGNGVRVQVEQQADALSALGHEVVRLNAWTPHDGRTFDVLHGVMGGLALHHFQRIGWYDSRVRVLAPVLDTNEPIWRYRLAAALGRRVPKVYTVPGELSRQASECDVVVCRSASEKDRVVRGLGVPEAKAKVVLNGVGPPPAADAALARSLIGTDGDFVLHLSSYCQPRKNVVRLIEAVGPTKIPLVLAGPPEDNAVGRRVAALCERFPSVRRLGFLSAAERDALLAACRVFALPSEHEGTGLAALEAAAGGAAVVITAQGGTRDYFQDHAAYVDPYDIMSIRAAVEDRFARPRDPALADHVRTNLTWEHSARALLAAYDNGRAVNHA